MGVDISRASKALALLVIAVCPASTQVLAQTGTARPATQAAAPVPSFVPPNFKVPVLAATKDFKIVPLGPDVVDRDFAAYMSSIDHLQKTFSRSTAWPHEGITSTEAMKDMTTEQARFNSRKSFAYAVLTPDGKRERGSVYVSPSAVPGYDATVRMWVTKADYDAGFDAELYAWITRWIRQDWPFANVAYPGRSIPWNTWDARVAASKVGKAPADKPAP